MLRRTVIVTSLLEMTFLNVFVSFNLLVKLTDQGLSTTSPCELPFNVDNVK